MPIDLTTEYGTLHLRSPIIIGACPLTAQEMSRIALVSAGAGAIVLPSLFEEQIRTWNQKQGFRATLSTPNEPVPKQVKQLRNAVIHDADSYLDLVKHASAEVSIPVIASINGAPHGNWLDFTKRLESAGATAIEFNIRLAATRHCPDPSEVENSIVDAVQKISEIIAIPLFVKLGRQYTSLSHLAHRLLFKAQGLVLFGQAPEFDISLENFQVVSRWGFSEPGSIASSFESIMRVHAIAPEMPLAASGGIGSSSDLVKVLLAGADAAMVTSAVYRDGPDIIASWLDSLGIFLERHDMGSLKELRNRRPKLFSDEDIRAFYVKALSSQPDPYLIRSANRTLECDRWGHIKTSK